METSNKLIIACTTNEKYIPFTRMFLNSIKDNSPWCDVYIKFVNCEKESIHNIITDYNIDNYSVDTIPLSKKRNRLSKENVPIHEFIKSGYKKNISTVKGARWLFSDEMSYCSNIRFAVINELLKKGFKNVLYSDVDAIINRDLEPLLDRIKRSDIAVRVDRNKETDNVSYPNRPITEPDGTLYHMGLLGVHNTPISQQVFAEIEKRVWDDMSDWDADHIEFYKIVEPKRKSNIIEVYDLEREFKDEGECPLTGEQDGFMDFSYIWSGAGSIKYTNEQYNKKLKEYG
tara:strand:+ start:611 stop:1471 length:861 start_codon:yes stop_codon:yes gene_type:complete